MIVALTCAAAALMAPQANKGPEIFNKMLQRYYAANTVKGTFELVQTAVGSETAKVRVATSLQVAKPNKVFLEQVRIPRSTEPEVRNHFSAVSDGQQISYTVPRDMLPFGSRDRVWEAAPPTISQCLDMVVPLTIDRSLPLAVSFYNVYEINEFSKKVSALQFVDETNYDGKSAYRLKADYAIMNVKVGSSVQPVRIPAYIFIDKEYNLIGIAYEETIAQENLRVKITSQWVVRLTVDGPVDAALFVVPKTSADR